MRPLAPVRRLLTIFGMPLLWPLKNTFSCAPQTVQAVHGRRAGKRLGQLAALDAVWVAVAVRAIICFFRPAESTIDNVLKVRQAAFITTVTWSELIIRYFASRLKCMQI